MLVLSRAEVKSLLDLDQLVEAVAAAMMDLSAGHASMPSRVAASISAHNAILAAMPAFLPSARALTTKLVSLFPNNEERPTHQAIICVFDPEDGTPLAVMDGSYVTATRTAAGSALATRLLARPDARVTAIVGTGVQGEAHAVAIARGAPTTMLRIAGRDRSKVDALVAELRDTAGLAVEAAPSIEDAVRGADVVCLATHAASPVLRSEWLKPGAHVNSVGYNTQGEGEVDLETLRTALLVVESRKAALAAPPAGAVDLRRAVQQGAISADRLPVEIGEILAGKAAGRTNDEQITLYKSVGVAVQDAAAAALIFKAATDRGVGTRLDF